MKRGFIKCRVLWSEDVNGRARVEIVESDGTMSTFVVSTDKITESGMLRVKVGDEREMEDNKNGSKEVRVRLSTIQNGEATGYNVYVSPDEIRRTKEALK